MDLITFIFLGVFSYFLYKVSTREQERFDCFKILLEEKYPDILEILKTEYYSLENTLVFLTLNQKNDKELSLILNKEIKTNMRIELTLNTIEFQKSTNSEITLDEILLFLRCQIKANEIQKFYGESDFEEIPETFRALKTLRL